MNTYKQKVAEVFCVIYLCDGDGAKWRIHFAQ